ncbi:NERD domain-containing protein [Streptomyces jumonjinensis]|uniref:NERD domain-containing protein n=1 Tax=Streptomyces jumonjinensis TaxID=1945 RepID=A0A646KLY5_STRJU|nr:NERD domain-containing protein [Streptomyces jumonjinensis]
MRSVCLSPGDRRAARVPFEDTAFEDTALCPRGPGGTIPVSRKGCGVAQGDAVDGLRVASWKRYGHDRLYVNLRDGTSVAWADRATGEVTLLHPGYRDAVLDALARHTAAARGTADPAPWALPPLTPEDDLLSRRPGAAIRALLAESGPGLLERVVTRLLRRESEWDSWRKGLAGERRVGAELNRLTRYGWRVLHSVPLPRDVDVDHLLIGPGGVFSVNTKHHDRRSVWVGDETARIDHGMPRPYPAKSRAEAQRVRGVLERFCGFAVPVQPVLVFVGVTALEVAAAQRDVHVCRDREIAALGPLTGVLTPARTEQIFAVARDRRSWLEA